MLCTGSRLKQVLILYLYVCGVAHVCIVVRQIICFSIAYIFKHTSCPVFARMLMCLYTSVYMCIYVCIVKLVLIHGSRVIFVYLFSRTNFDNSILELFECDVGNRMNMNQTKGQCVCSCIQKLYFWNDYDLYGMFQRR